MAKLRWIESRGGPLVLLPATHLGHWLGSYLPADDLNPAEVQTSRGEFFLSLDSSFGLPPTHFERACSAGPIELLDVGQVKVLVVGGEPLRTAWWQIDADAGILVRWICADSEKKIIADLEGIPVLEGEQKLTCTIDAPELLLIDAMDLGEKLEGESLRVTLAPGTYDIATIEEYSASEGTALTLHWFRKVV